MEIKQANSLEDVKKKAAIIENYDSKFKTIKNINISCEKEDAEYKKTLHDKERKIAEIQKGKIIENNKYSDLMQELAKSKIIINF